MFPYPLHCLLEKLENTTVIHIQFWFILLLYSYFEICMVKYYFYTYSANVKFRLQHGNENKIIHLQKKGT